MSLGPGKPNLDPLIGRSVGDYRLESRIGAGATGVVYRAIHEPTGRAAAVKVLNDHLGRISSLERRFRREARVLNKLQHPYIVHIDEYGVTEEATYIAMELLEGETLDQRMHRSSIEPEKILEYARAILEALAHAHAHEIVHRDLKPANVFLPRSGEPPVKLLDFGLAKFLAIDELSGDVTLTRKGRVVGTPAYMAPEQITGVSLDPRADVYAFGVLLFEMIADRRPFEYGKRSELLRAHLFEPPPKLEKIRPDLRIDPMLEGIVQRALAKDPDDRFQSADEMLATLRRLPEGALTHGGKPRPTRTERPRGETSSVLMSDAELAEARKPRSKPPESRPVRPPEGERRSRAPAKRASGGQAQNVSTDESSRLPTWLWVAAVAVALTTGLLSYWIGSRLP